MIHLNVNLAEEDAGTLVDIMTYAHARANAFLEQETSMPAHLKDIYRRESLVSKGILRALNIKVKED